MESKKVKEIKKGLECCKQNEIENTCEYCGNCPASNWDYETECNVELFQRALTLINHQDFQISTLKVQVANLEKELKKEQKNHLYYRQDSKFKERRITKLENENAKLLDSVESVQAGRCIYKCELTKKHLTKFAEKLKDDIEHHHGNYGDLSYSECEHIIDETLKECLCDKYQ